ncbi:uncharacterized protein LOC126937251 [Macaca thibetana thibetana]|uniref:uncharacterized protein LOC126937251 n=1 Tax=Macaca thibetana thibetana TaxID=257877 RepID=UPI0021BCD877|nr:uncharacterized protein LOC126937251 [Macaca thibetana thibetana]
MPRGLLGCLVIRPVTMNLSKDALQVICQTSCFMPSPHHGNPCAHGPGLLSRHSQLLGVRGRTHHSRDAGPAWRGPFHDTYGITGLCGGAQPPELTGYHSALKPHRKSDLNSSTGSSQYLQLPSSLTLKLQLQHELLPGLQLHDPQTTTAAPAPHWISSSMTLGLDRQHRLPAKTLSSAILNLEQQHQLLPGLQLHDPQPRTAAPAPPWISSSMTL